MFAHDSANPLGSYERCPILAFALIIIMTHAKIFKTNIRATDSQEQVTRRRYRTRSQAKKMVKEYGTRFERLKRSHQETQEQIAELKEMIRVLIRERGQTVTQDPQNGAAQPEQRREEPTYPKDLLPNMHKRNLCLKWEGSHTVMHLPQHRHTR